MYVAVTSDEYNTADGFFERPLLENFDAAEEVPYLEHGRLRAVRAVDDVRLY